MRRLAACLLASLTLVVAWRPVGADGSATAVLGLAAGGPGLPAVGQSWSPLAAVPPVRGPVLR
ncbi:MAG: hypothetical protein M3415_08060, partial [Actinomycetota bacterium]|nr:hypothetical protein [Actinomycetota bacterium]